MTDNIEAQRRRWLAGTAFTAVSSGLAACAAPGSTVPAGRPGTPTDFVLVHGAWHGAWCWRRVAERLQRAGHRTWVPTLSGLADRGHLLAPSTTLQTHIDDVVRLVQWEDLDSIVLVGHSYGGMVVSGAVEVLGQRVRSLVYLDAFVPEAGQSALDIAGPAARERLGSAAAAGAPLPPLPAAAFVGAGHPDIPWLTAKMTAHPGATFDGRLAQTRVRDALARKTYVRARKFPNPGFDGLAAKFKGQAGWQVHDLAEHQHDLMVTAPDLTTELLLAAAS